MIDELLFLVLGISVGVLLTRIRMLKKISLKPNPKEETAHVLSEQSDFSEKVWHTQEAEFIFRLNEQLGLTFNRHDIAHSIVEAVHKFFYVHATVLLFLDKEASLLTIESAAGIAHEIREKTVFGKTESISGIVLSRRQPLLVNVLDEEHYLKKQNKEPYFRNSFMSVPLFLQSDVLGVLHVCDKKSEKEFTKKDMTLLVNIGRLAGIVLKNAVLHEEVQEGYFRTITVLARALDARDSYTRHHSENVTRYSLAIVRQMQLSHAQYETIRRAALLHDIGKIGIRDAILNKPGILSEEEFKEIKLHPAKGEEIIKALPFLKEVASLVRHHHERFDGKGYPDGVKGAAIALGARIMAVADSFDAMTSDRPYRKALDTQVAIEELERCTGKQLCPLAVDAFLKVFESGGLIE